MSGPQSVSTVSHHDSPATPHTNYEGDFDDSKHVYSGYASAVYQQSLQDVFPDNTFTPNGMVYPQQQQTMQRVNGQHRPSMFAERLHAAQQDHLRTKSPITSNPRENSPFRQNSPYNHGAMPAPTQRPQPVPQLQRTRTSVSPKELMLDEHDIDEDNSTPLFQDQPQHMFSNRRHA